MANPAQIAGRQLFSAIADQARQQIDEGRKQEGRSRFPNVKGSDRLAVPGGTAVPRGAGQILDQLIGPQFWDQLDQYKSMVPQSPEAKEAVGHLARGMRQLTPLMSELAQMRTAPQGKAGPAVRLGRALNPFYDKQQKQREFAIKADLTIRALNSYVAAANAIDRLDPGNPMRDELLKSIGIFAGEAVTAPFRSRMGMMELQEKFAAADQALADLGQPPISEGVKAALIEADIGATDVADRARQIALDQAKLRDHYEGIAQELPTSMDPMKAFPPGTLTEDEAAMMRGVQKQRDKEAAEDKILTPGEMESSMRTSYNKWVDYYMQNMPKVLETIRISESEGMGLFGSGERITQEPRTPGEFYELAQRLARKKMSEMLPGRTDWDKTFAETLPEFFDVNLTEAEIKLRQLALKGADTALELIREGETETEGQAGAEAK